MTCPPTSFKKEQCHKIFTFPFFITLQIAMKYLKDFEPLHKNVLAQESWAQISLIMKKQGRQ